MGQAYPGTVAAPNFVMTLEKDTVMTLNNCTSEPTLRHIFPNWRARRAGNLPRGAAKSDLLQGLFAKP